MRVLVAGLTIFLLGVGQRAEVLAQSVETGPTLVTDAAPASGDGATRRFTIASRILSETRRIGIERPASYARSAAAHR